MWKPWNMWCVWACDYAWHPYVNYSSPASLTMKPLCELTVNSLSLLEIIARVAISTANIRSWWNLNFHLFVIIFSSRRQNLEVGARRCWRRLRLPNPSVRGNCARALPKSGENSAILQLKVQEAVLGECLLFFQSVKLSEVNLVVRLRKLNLFWHIQFRNLNIPGNEKKSMETSTDAFRSRFPYKNRSELILLLEIMFSDTKP